MPLSFAELVSLLEQPPYEQCESELQYLARVQYDRAFTEAVRLHYRGVNFLIARGLNSSSSSTSVFIGQRRRKSCDQIVPRISAADFIPHGEGAA